MGLKLNNYTLHDVRCQFLSVFDSFATTSMRTYIQNCDFRTSLGELSDHMSLEANLVNMRLRSQAMSCDRMKYNVEVQSSWVPHARVHVPRKYT